MQKQAEIQQQNDVLVISGDIDFSNVMSLYAASLPLLDARQAITVDFSPLKSSNSAVFALMIEWLKYTRAKKKIIQFQHLSPQWAAIAKVAGLDQII